MTAIRRKLIWLFAFALLGCGGGSAAPAPEPPAPPAATISLLFMGNSHTSANQLPAMVAAMVRAARPGQTVSAVEAPEWMFLEDRSTHAASLQLLRGTRWNAVFLQAQKYSMSGNFSYPTTGAEALIRESRMVGALPVLFPEWPQRGVDETARIHDLHVSIAVRAPACVAPVGHAWDLALKRHPGLVLHAPDGNHAAASGSFLAALMLATTYTRFAPEQLPFIPGFNVDAAMQEQLRRVAADTAAAYPVRQWCPGDA